MNQNNTNVPQDPILEAKRTQVAKEIEKLVSEAGLQLFQFIEHTQNGSMIPRVAIVQVPSQPSEVEAKPDEVKEA
mgnify:CR=1 FL=1